MVRCSIRNTMLICLAVGFSVVASADVFVSDEKYESAIATSRALLKQRIEAGHPGLSVAVRIQGELVWAEGFGYADLEAKRSVAQNTQFRIGSTSKAVTGVALGHLIERNAIDIDAPIQTYVPGFPEKPHPITPRLLAGNLGGIRHYRGMESFNKKHYPTLTEGLRIFQDDPLVAEPGTKFSYSSYGFNLLGVAIEGASGLDYLSFVQKEIFGPLEMNHSAGDDVTREMPDRAVFYAKRTKGPRIAGMVDDSYKWPSGGLLSTPSDMTRFGSALLAPGYLKEETLNLLFTSQETADGKKTRYGMGFRIAEPTEARPYRLLHHGGSSAGCMSMLIIATQPAISQARSSQFGTPKASLAMPGIVVSTLTNYTGYRERDSDARSIIAAFASER